MKHPLTAHGCLCYTRLAYPMFAGLCTELFSKRLIFTVLKISFKYRPQASPGEGDGGGEEEGVALPSGIEMILIQYLNSNSAAQKVKKVLEK